MENFIIVDFRGSTKVSITQKAMENLKSYRPNGCPFENYSMLDLLKDWVNMYSWQIVQRNKQISLVVNENNDNALNILKTIYKQEKEKNKDLTLEFLDDFMEYLRIQDESLKLRRK